MFVERDLVLVVAVFFHQLLNVFQSAIKFFGGEQLAELQLAGVGNLAGRGAAELRFQADYADEVIWIGDERDAHAVSGAVGLDADVGKTPGGVERSDAGADLVTVKSLTGMDEQEAAQADLFGEFLDVGE